MLQSDQTEELFGRTSVPQAVFKMSVPMVLSSLVGIFYNLADTYFVGMLNRPSANAAVTLAGTVMLAFNAVNNLFGVGTSSLMSRALGEKNYDKTIRSSVFGIYSALVCSAVFSLLCFLFMEPLVTLLGADSITKAETIEYMNWTVVMGAVPSIMHTVFAALIRAEGQALHASIGLMSGCVLNIVLDPFFVLPWGLDMGAAGAGCATFISNCAALLYFVVLVVLKHERTFICLNPAKLTFDRDIIRGIFSVGIPASIQNLTNVASFTILNAAAASFGAAAVAAMGIAKKIHDVPQQIAMGIPTGAMPLIGYNYAARNGKRLKDVLLFSAKMAAAVLAIPLGMGIFFPETVMAAFIENEEIIHTGGIILRMMCIAIPFNCVDSLAVNIFQAIGKGRNSLLFAVVRKLIIEIPCIYLFNRILPLYGLACALPVTEFIMMIMGIYFIRRILDAVN